MKFTLRLQRRRAARTGPSISLFPFLAVLICTMGALVPLLLAMMRTARVQAEAAAVAKAAEETAKHGAELKTLREDVLWRTEQLKKSREQKASQLAEARLELGHLEDHSRRLRAELERYQNTVADLDNIENADRQKHGQSEAELQQMRRQIAAVRQQIDEAHKTAATRPRSYAVVPYEGPNQTRRRPIYLECLANAVVLQPEGIRLTEDDFDGPMGPGNPLAAALRAARQQLLAEREFDPQAGEPYPMLLVRPEGIGAYYAAREAMKSWGSDFGYELIGDDWKLAYQQPNPRLAEVVGQAIASARINQARLIAAAPREYPSRPKTTYRATSHGGFVREDGGSDEDDRGYRPATPAGSVGRNGGGYGGRGSGGYGGRETGTTSEYNPYVAVAEGPGTAVPGNGGSSTGTPSGGAFSGAGPALASADGSPVAGGGGGGVGGSAGGGSAGGAVGGMTGGNSGGMAGGSANGMAGGNVGGMAGGNANGMTGGNVGGMAGGNANGMTGGNVGGMTGGNANGMTGGNVGGTWSSGTGAPGNTIPGGAGDGTGSANAYVTTPEHMGSATSESGGTPSGAPSGRYGDASGGSPPTTSQRSNSPQNGATAPERPEGYVAGQPLRESTSPTTSNQPPSGEVASGHALRPGEWEPTPDPPPKPRDDKDDDPLGKKNGHKPPRSLAEQRGEDWGLRDAARGSVGVTRPIRIECYADRLVVISDRTPADNKVIPLGQNTASSIDTFVSTVWGHIEGWGIAGRGMYWRPTLQVSVAPGAEERFADLAALLDGSGLMVKRRQGVVGSGQ